MNKYSYLPQQTVRTLKTETPCYSSLNHQHLRQGLGHNRVQLGLLMIIKFIVYIISGWPVTILAIIIIIFLSIPTVEEQLCRFADRKEECTHTHTETLLQIPPQERESNGHKKVNSKSRARCRRWCVVSASMGCVGDTELCTDKSEESHYPFNFTSPFWKIQAHNLFLFTIMNVSNHQDLLILQIVSTIPSSTWVKSRISTHVSLKIFMSSASQGPIKPTSLQVNKKHLLFELSTLVRKVYVTIFSLKEEVKIQFKFYEYHDRDSWLSIHCLGQQLNQVLLAMLLSPPISSLLPLF